MEKKDEIFISVLDFENIYEISNYGVLRNILSEKNMKSRIDKDGYVIYTLCKNGRRKDLKAHRIVLASFSKKWDKRTVNHKDGIKSHNFLDNLEWATQIKNRIKKTIIRNKKPSWNFKNKT